MSFVHETTRQECDALLQKQQEQKARLALLKGKFEAALKPNERLEISQLPKDISNVHKQLVAKRRVYR